MNRRELLKKSTMAAMGLSFAPGLLLSLESCAKARPTSNLPVFLSQEQFDTLWIMAELIIPKTDTPGADDAGVAPFIDQLFGDYFDDADKLKYEEGLNLLMENCIKIYGKSFTELEGASQLEYLEKLDKEESRESFFRSIKGIICWAYFTSEPGMKSMNYLPVPGRYNGCIPIDDQEKNLVGNR